MYDFRIIGGGAFGLMCAGRREKGSGEDWWLWNGRIIKKR